MSLKYLYLLLNLGTLLVPFLFSFRKEANFSKEWKYFLPANLLVAFGFIIWDIAFTKMGVWGFNPDYLCGIYLANLPLEEVLFFITIPYACTFIFFSMRYFFPKPLFVSGQRKVFLIWSIIALIVGLVFLDKWYTSTTFILCAFLFVYMAYRQKEYYGHMLLAFLISTIPFLVVNGVLTGSFLSAPVVWYNDAENIGVRIFTIPIEDTHYSLLLQFLNVTCYLGIKSVSLKRIKNKCS